MSAKRQKWIDGSAMSLSLLCLFHCLAMPFVVSVLPILGSHFLEHTAVHLGFLLLALPLSFFGLWLGVKGAHGGAKLMGIAAVGLGLMAIGTWHDLVGEWDIPLTVVGVSLVGLAHFLNWRRHEKVHQHLPHEHLIHHADEACPCHDHGHEQEVAHDRARERDLEVPLSAGAEEPEGLR